MTVIMLKGIDSDIIDGKPNKTGLGAHSLLASLTVHLTKSG